MSGRWMNWFSWLRMPAKPTDDELLAVAITRFLVAVGAVFIAGAAAWLFT